MAVRVHCVHFVCLLQVLVGPHVRGDGGRKGVVGQPFRTLSWVGGGWRVEGGGVRGEGESGGVGYI